jgi:hypothetical protein
MHSRPLQAGKKYFLKHATQTVQAIVTKLESRINMTTLEPEPDPARAGHQRHRRHPPQDRQTARVRRLHHEPADRLVHLDRAGHERHRRAGNAVRAHRSRETPEYTDFAI